MERRRLTGVIPPVVVPLTQDRKLDVASFERSINRMIEAGVDGLFILGSSSEVVFSTDARRTEVIKQAVRIVDHRVPLLCGIIDTETERMIDQGKRVEQMGVDALVATCPFYALQSMEDVEWSFRYLHEALSLPIYAYDIPVSVHMKLDVNMLVRLGTDGVIAGVKDSSGDDASFRRLILKNRAAGSPLQLFTGQEVVVDGAYLSGADGSVPGLANVDPDGYVRQWKAAQAGDWKAVRDEQDRLARIMEITEATRDVQGFGAGVGAFKTALMLMGVFEANQMPRPVHALKGENVEIIRRVLMEQGLL